LITKLDQAQSCPLTLIAAPLGFGKATLLREWMPHNPHCVTWLALDVGGNDPARFWPLLHRRTQASMRTKKLGLLKSQLLPLPSKINHPMCLLRYDSRAG
jgi:hypothetical protein